MKTLGLSTKEDRDALARRIKAKSKTFSKVSEPYAQAASQRLNRWCRRFK